LGRAHWDVNGDYQRVSLRVLNIINGDIHSLFRTEPPNMMAGYVFNAQGVFARSVCIAQ